MQRNVTAVYRTHATAELVQRELKELGYSSMSVSVIPDGDHSTDASYDYKDDLDDIHDLHLPEDDVRTYQNAVRRGDYVVSVNVDDEDYLSRVQEIMRRPEQEAYILDDVDREFAGADYTPYGRTRPANYDESWMGTRDATSDDRHTRLYQRRQAIPHNL